jgi:hypothetical protein
MATTACVRVIIIPTSIVVAYNVMYAEVWQASPQASVSFWKGI